MMVVVLLVVYDVLGLWMRIGITVYEECLKFMYKPICYWYINKSCCSGIHTRKAM